MEEIEKHIIELSKDYANIVLGIDTDNLTIKFSDDICEDFLETTGMNKTIGSLGVYIHPAKIEDMATIILERAPNGEPQPNACITLIHELIHHDDLCRFNNLYCQGDWSIIENSSVFQYFMLWSEFHAKAMSLIYGRNFAQFIIKDCAYDESFIKEEMLNIQLPIYNAEILNRLKDGVTK